MDRTTPPPLQPISELAARLRQGQTTAAALLEECLDRIATHDPQLNAFITVLTESARARAAAADRELARGHDLGALHGIPVSVKDLIDLNGVPTTAASRVRSDHRAHADAPVLAQLRARGAVFVGKCNLHEFAFGTTGEDSAFGPTCNPHAPGRIPGGSSSGSAVSVATGMAAFSVGTDTGGSIRIPAAACGVVGLKPTFGELSCLGVVPLGATLDHVGPIGPTVGDVEIGYRAMAGSQLDMPSASTPNAPARLRLGLLRDYFLDVMDDQVRVAFENTVDRLGRVGHAIHEVRIPHAETIAEVYRYTVLYEALQVHAPMLEAQPQDYTAGVLKRLRAGFEVTADDYHDAQRRRIVLTQEVDAAIEQCDALILPTLPVAAPPFGTADITIGKAVYDIRGLTLRLTQLFDLTGHPAITLPCGETDDGLPCGVQLVGGSGDTPELLGAALRCEDEIRSW